MRLEIKKATAIRENLIRIAVTVYRGEEYAGDYELAIHSLSNDTLDSIGARILAAIQGLEDTATRAFWLNNKTIIISDDYEVPAVLDGYKKAEGE